ncbi:MAG: CheR family methyltransferase [Myxococcaceae bacterium]
MIVAPETAEGVRRALESRFGLALPSLSTQELGNTIALVANEGRPEDADPNEAQFLVRLLDRLPIDESSLFRHRELWSWLSERVLPELLDQTFALGRPLRALSIGCAGGQEAFSLAIALQELLHSRGVIRALGHRFARITGIDASPGRVERARSGLLNAWSVDRAPVEWLRELVAPDPAVPGQYRVDPAVMAMCQFDCVNLLGSLDDSLLLGGYDLVLFQHVLIYFREPMALEVLRKMAAALDSNAVLVLSPVEAHLLEQLPRMKPLDHIGAVRVSSGAPPLAPRRPPQPRRSPRRPSCSGPVGAGPAAPEGAARLALLEEHVSTALQQSAKGRLSEALQAARSACALEPSHLVARLVLGQVLLSVDPPQGLAVLRTLLEQTDRLEPDSWVPLAMELTVNQLASAARLLLEGRRE